MKTKINNKMKWLISLTLIMSFGVALTSCEDDNGSNPTLTFPKSFVLNTPGLAASNVYDLPNGTVNLTTSQPDYGGWPAAVTYAVQVSLTGADGTWKELPTTYTSTRMSVSGDEINQVVLDEYRAANDKNDPEGDTPIYLRLRAFLADTGMNFGEVFSNAISINVRSYDAPTELTLPTSIYVCGNSIADAWSTWKFVPAVFGKEGRFYTMIYNNADGFKWGNKANDWYGYDMIDEFDTAKAPGLTVSTDNDGNIVFDKAGWFVLKFIASIEGKRIKYKLVIADGAAGVIGNGIGNWDGELMEVPADKSPWTFSNFTGSGELRAYIVVPDEDWWRCEYTIKDGELVWRDNEHNSDSSWLQDVGEDYSVTVGAGSVLTVDFDRSQGSVK